MGSNLLNYAYSHSVCQDKSNGITSFSEMSSSKYPYPESHKLPWSGWQLVFAKKFENYPYPTVVWIIFYFSEDEEFYSNQRTKSCAELAIRPVVEVKPSYNSMQARRPSLPAKLKYPPIKIDKPESKQASPAHTRPKSRTPISDSSDTDSSEMIQRKVFCCTINNFLICLAQTTWSLQSKTIYRWKVAPANTATTNTIRQWKET